MSDHGLDAKLNQREHVLLKKKDKNISKRTTEIKNINRKKRDRKVSTRTGKGKKFGSAILYAFAFPNRQLVSCTYVDSINQTMPLQAKVFFRCAKVNT